MTFEEWLIANFDYGTERYLLLDDKTLYQALKECWDQAYTEGILQGENEGYVAGLFDQDD